MINDSLHRVSLIFSLILHVVLFIFLFIKFTQPKSSVIGFSSNVINAIAINERSFNNQVNRALANQISAKMEKADRVSEAVTNPQSYPTKTIKNKMIEKEQLPILLKKTLLAEKAQEIAELKKTRKKYKKMIAEQKELQEQKMLENQVALEQKQLTDLQAETYGGGGLAGEADKYKGLIIQAISSQWIIPEGANAEDFCQLLINVAPGGVILDVRLVKSNGNATWDRSTQAAVFKSSPLPVPEDVKLFDRFRTIKLMFKPGGIVGG